MIFVSASVLVQHLVIEFVYFIQLSTGYVKNASFADSTFSPHANQMFHQSANKNSEKRYKFFMPL